MPRFDEWEVEQIEFEAGLTEARAEIAAAMQRLPADQREAVELRVIHEREYAEIAEQLSIKEPAARARVSRALRTLASQLESTRPLLDDAA